jgi:hypothetical protein
MLTQRDSQHKKEIDLVAMKQGEKLYIQVANDISDTVSHVIGLANFNYTSDLQIDVSTVQRFIECQLAGK